MKCFELRPWNVGDEGKTFLMTLTKGLRPSDDAQCFHRGADLLHHVQDLPGRALPPGLNVTKLFTDLIYERLAMEKHLLIVK